MRMLRRLLVVVVFGALFFGAWRFVGRQRRAHRLDLVLFELHRGAALVGAARRLRARRALRRRFAGLRAGQEVLRGAPLSQGAGRPRVGDPPAPQPPARCARRARRAGAAPAGPAPQAAARAAGLNGMRFRRGGPGGARRSTSRASSRPFVSRSAALLEDDLDGAEQALAAVVQEDSTQIEIYLALGQLYRRRGEIGRAIRIHQNLLLRSDLAARAPRARAARPGARLQEGRLPAARDLGLRGAARSPASRSRGAARRSCGCAQTCATSTRPSTRTTASSARRGRTAARPRRGSGSNAARRSPPRARATPRGARSASACAATPRWRWRGSGSASSRPSAASTRRRWRPGRGRSRADRRAAARIYPRLETAWAALGRAREFEAELRAELAQRPGRRGGAPRAGAHARRARAGRAGARGAGGAVRTRARPARRPRRARAHRARRRARRRGHQGPGRAARRARTPGRAGGTRGAGDDAPRARRR